ncbi:acyl carrier protein [Microbispora sp. RL4-1S]|uniref:Acyl carrier protein n=1 Tax=Microbispora oryzae TaxID=2806554 RepID=A0A941ASA5_9ACTN|nr:acyl carrier protein [Microbispora oryzae]MBP2707789.1 acyl carrier protein [Microbispora oryzae]
MTDRTRVPEDGLDLDGTPAEILQAVWADALGVAEVDPDAGFFDLGATSEMILGVVRVLRRRWPRLRIVDVFSHPTVAQLAAFLDDE